MPTLALGGGGAAGGLGAAFDVSAPLVTTPLVNIGLVETTWQTESVRTALLTLTNPNPNPNPNQTESVRTALLQPAML